MKFIEKTIKKSELFELTKKQFGNLVKAVVDIKQGFMSIGGELHSDEEAFLLEEKNSNQKDLWGINLYLDKSGEEFIEFDSMINLRPSQGNDSRGINDPEIRKKIIEIINILIEEFES